jgi:hypothetical protein
MLNEFFRLNWEIIKLQWRLFPYSIALVLIILAIYGVVMILKNIFK